MERSPRQLRPPAQGPSVSGPFVTLGGHAAALIDAPTFSMISPISFSLTMSGGVSSIVSRTGKS